MRRLMPTMERKSTGTISERAKVSTQSSAATTQSMPTSITSELTSGRRPFMVSGLDGEGVGREAVEEIATAPAVKGEREALVRSA